MSDVSFLERRFTAKNFPIESFVKVASKYQIGDILYVRETFRPITGVCFESDEIGIQYKADRQRRVWSAEVEDAYAVFDGKWKPSIFLPKKFSRIFLKVTNVRVERLNEITADDIVAEGMPKSLTHYSLEDRREQYIKLWWQPLWDSINKKRGYSWKSNPWVFVYEFEKIDISTLPYMVV